MASSVSAIDQSLVESVTMSASKRHAPRPVVAYPETRAIFSRLRRSGHLSVSQFTTVKAEFETQWHTLLAVEVTAAISREAGDFAERYALRGFDALHLASFSAVARRAGASQTDFASFDVKLNRAAADIARRLGSMG